MSVLFLAAALQQYLGSRASLEKEGQSLAECQGIAEQLNQLATRPKLASVDSSANQSGANQINAAIQKAGIDSISLRSVSPSPTVRLGTSDYQQRETTVSFTNVSLTQIVLFEQGLNAGLGITLSDLTLSIPEEANATAAEAELWDARLTLTQIIYSPKSPK